MQNKEALTQFPLTGLLVVNKILYFTDLYPILDIINDRSAKNPAQRRMEGWVAASNTGGGAY